MVTRSVLHVGPGGPGAPPHTHDGSEIEGTADLIHLRVDQLLAGTITGKEITVAGGAAGVIRSDNFISGVDGWAIFGDGSAELNAVVVRGTIVAGTGSEVDWSYIKNVSIENADIVSLSFDKITAGSNDASLVIGATGSISTSNYVAGTSGILISESLTEFNDVVLRGDLVSANWDGADPVDLSSRDTTATAGYALDSAAGAAQFMGDLFLGGSLFVRFDGEIVVGNPDQAHIEVVGDPRGQIRFVDTDGNTKGTIDGAINENLGLFLGATGSVVSVEGMNGVFLRGRADTNTESRVRVGDLDDGSYVVVEKREWITFDPVPTYDTTTLLTITDTAGHNLQGLDYDDYTPTLTGLSVGSTGTIGTARYVRIGDVVHVEIVIFLGGPGIFVGDVRIQLPFNPAFGTNSPAAGECLLVESGVGIHKGALNFADNALHVRRLQVSGSSVTLANLSSTTPFTWGDGDSIRISAIYKAA